MEGRWDAYLEVEGVSGESMRAGHEDQIEVISFDFSASNPSSVGIGSGGGVGAVNLSSFNFMKKTDASSADLFKHCCSGKHFPTATLTLYKAGGDGGALDYLIYEFEEVYVDAINWSGSEGGGDGIPLEQVSFSFGKVVVTYNQQDEKGAKAGSFMGSWDVRTKTP
ncbi:MAG: type VI secretion system tube protein Hcp [Gemmatimonadota bacterium]|jgi:type VI secretion system secreted protein Hcp